MQRETKEMPHTQIKQDRYGTIQENLETYQMQHR
jgi:hypothetical protein